MTQPFIARRRESAAPVPASPGSHPFLACSADTGGAVECALVSLNPGEGPPLHLHPDQDEALYLIEGQVCLQIGEALHPLQAGDFAFIPSGTAHTLANVGPMPARAVQFFTPGGLAAFCRDVLEAAPEALAQAGACFASEAQPAVGPPLCPDRARSLVSA